MAAQTEIPDERLAQCLQGGGVGDGKAPRGGMRGEGPERGRMMRRAAALSASGVRIMLALRAGEASTRRELAERLGSTQSTVAFHVRRLIDAGYVAAASATRLGKGSMPGRHELTDLGQAILRELER